LSATSKIMRRETRYDITQPASVLLDVVRFGAAFAVLMMHCSEFGTGWANRERWGDIAVPVFFVLSGFVIRLVTRAREGNARGYAIDRVSRMYSVVIPAMLLTVACSILCRMLDAERFLQNRDSFGHPLKAVFANLTFVSQIWSHNAVPFVNIPFWSLGYECPYYVFYGLMFFLSGWKRGVAGIAWAVFVGPQILFLLPLWWWGVWICDTYQRLRHRNGVAIFSAVVLTLWLISSLVSEAGHAITSRISIQAIFHAIATVPNPLRIAGFPELRATMVAQAAGLVSGILLLLVLLAIEKISWKIPQCVKESIRRVADGTFVLYLFHYPLLYVCSYAKLFRPGHEFQNISAMSGIVLLCVAAAGPLDALKSSMRSWLNARMRTPSINLETAAT